MVERNHSISSPVISFFVFALLGQRRPSNKGGTFLHTAFWRCVAPYTWHGCRVEPKTMSVIMYGLLTLTSNHTLDLEAVLEPQKQLFFLLVRLSARGVGWMCTWTGETISLFACSVLRTVAHTLNQVSWNWKHSRRALSWTATVVCLCFVGWLVVLVVVLVVVVVVAIIFVFVCVAVVVCVGVFLFVLFCLVWLGFFCAYEQYRKKHMFGIHEYVAVSSASPTVLLSCMFAVCAVGFRLKAWPYFTWRQWRVNEWVREREEGRGEREGGRERERVRERNSLGNYLYSFTNTLLVAATANRHENEHTPLTD